MATKNVSFSLSGNTLYQTVQSTAVITGKTVYGRTVTVTETITQAAESGSIRVSSASDWHLDGASGSAEFTVSWTGLTPGSTITLSGSSGMSGISPASITNISANGSETVTFNYSALSTGSRKLTLTASGTDGNGDTKTGSDYYQQHGRGGSSGSTLDVSAVTSSPVAASTTSVTFRVTWSEVYGTITLTPSVGTASPTTISANGSSSRDITVTMGANSSPTSRDVKLTATTTFNSLTDDATIVQNGVGYSPDIWWTETNGGSTAVSSISDVPAYVSGTYDGRNVTYIIYVNYNSDVTGYTMNTSSLTNGASASNNGNTVTITAPVNETTSTRSLGSITVVGTAPDGSTDSATLSITQEEGVSPVLSLDPASQTIAADGTSATATLTYDYVDPSSIAKSSQTGNITNVTIS